MKHEKTTEDFIKLIDSDKKLKSLVEKSLYLAKINNPNKTSNPATNLEELYEFLDWSVKCMPWEVLNHETYSSLYSAIDQALGYIWYLFDQPLDELKDMGFYYPSVQYVEPLTSWLKEYSVAWGKFLSTSESWNDDYFNLAKKDDKFGLNRGWYSDENIWTSFNDFFSRQLIDKSVRPISDALVISPADSSPQGFYKIDENNKVINDDLYIKSARLNDVAQLIGEDSKYCNLFSGGTLTHTFLDVNDYHRYHFPVNGKILELRKIKGINAGGGISEWSASENRYIYFNELGFQMIETRDCVILDTEDFGLVAVLPIGMSQVCSCNFENNLQVNMNVKKGDPMGYFLFGGSDIVMIFQKDVQVIDLTNKKKNESKHLLMGEPYADLIKKMPMNK